MFELQSDQTLESYRQQLLREIYTEEAHNANLKQQKTEEVVVEKIAQKQSNFYYWLGYEGKTKNKKINDYFAVYQRFLTEHENLTIILIWLPIILMCFYIICVEG